MNHSELRNLLQEIKTGKTSVEKGAERIIKNPMFTDLKHTKIDNSRITRTGMHEAVYCSSKTSEQIIDIFRKMKEDGNDIIATRIEKAKAERVTQEFPESDYYPDAEIITLKQKNSEHTRSDTFVAIVTGGTSDLPVAREAQITAEFNGHRTRLYSDCGIAGVHRFFHNLEEIKKAKVIIVVAGMEGALAGIVAGQVDKPVIAVPTSVGYGASFHGLSALLTMLNSCAPGISVVNIDNGFGAGVYAGIIDRI
ncbi:MAG: nickel pincer cofactor biosynthesis protein LarB [Chitinivibrionales bacterium]